MSMKTHKRNRIRGTRSRRGVTLIELIVAVTILMLGLLSIVGISASIARSLGEARSDGLAAMAAQSRFEKLAGTACSSFSLGTWVSDSLRGISERYAVADGGNGTRLITDSVSWKTRRITRRATFQSLLPCRPGA
jgi:prepilin-type N-terminal cleavage/methylation domain-containing protein